MRSNTTMDITPQEQPISTPAPPVEVPIQPQQTPPPARPVRTSERVKKRKAAPPTAPKEGGRKRQKMSAPPTASTKTSASPVSMPMLNEVKALVDQLKELNEELKALKAQQVAEGASKPSTGDPDSDDMANAGANPLPKRRRRRAMSREQKERLHVRICTLSGEKLQGVLDLIAKEAPEALVTPSDTEVELDLSVLPSSKLWILYDYCNRSA